VVQLPVLNPQRTGRLRGQRRISNARGHTLRHSASDNQRTENFVNNFYLGAYGRGATATELQQQRDALNTAASQNQAAVQAQADTFGRSLFVGQVNDASISNTQYVTDLYNAYLQRGPDSAGLNFWVSNTQANGRAATLNAFEVCAEFATLASTVYGTASGGDNQRVEHFVQEFYYGALQREPTSAEMQQQTQRLNNAAALGQSQVVAEAQAMGGEIFQASNYNSSHTIEQYVTDLYEAFLQRAPDGPGLNFWVNNTVANGRPATLAAFKVCTEYAELAGTLYREAFWLVADQLGTPRMIVNKSGSLASVKRHDYLPFGEELFATQGGRTTTQGYATSPNSNDGVRQKFTQKERDNETGLDYFGARYYASMQGRFTSPDAMSGRPGSPQSWNRYSYSINNPLKFIDPSGLLWYAKNGGNGQPEWFDKDPGDGYTQINDYAYYAGEKYGYVALDPYSNNYLTGFGSKEDAAAFSGAMGAQTMLDRDPPYEISQLDGTLEVSMYITGVTGIVRGGSSLLAREGTELIAEQGANAATREIVGLYGRVSVDALEEAAASSGPTVEVVTKLTQLPQAGRALSVATGEGAEQLANAARSTGQIFRAQVPKTLMDQLERSGLAMRSTSQMVGSNATAVEYRFLPQATQFITSFFK